MAKNKLKTAGYTHVTQKSLSAAVNNYESISHGSASMITEPVSNVDVRVPFQRKDYEYFRPNEGIPAKFKDQVTLCRAVYKQMGIIRNVIDMMTDFACEDLRIVHPDKNIEAFFRVWQKKTGLDAACVEFARHAQIECNVVVKRVTARINKPYQKFIKDSTVGKPDVKIVVPKREFLDKEIPWRYIFLDITSLDWRGGDEARMFVDRPLLFKLPSKLIKMIKNPQDDFQKKIVENIPQDIKDQILNSKTSEIELDMSKIYVAHLKKDSWEDWATPFMVAVLPDLFFKQKLRQADIAALDGVINVIRLWRLGDHKEKILPDEGAVSRLADILKSNVGGGAVDIIWDSLLDMKEFYPPVDKILGSEKYQQVNNDILVGLGVPDVLLGGAGANFSNSYIQLKTLVERLEYLRRTITSWLNKEIELVCTAMGFEVLPKVVFNDMSLQDEDTHKRLIVGLMDRGIISAETVLRIYGEDLDIEYPRIKTEKKTFEKDGIEAPKGPFDGKTSPGEPGRPSTTKDLTKRNTRSPKPRTSQLFTLISNAMDDFDNKEVPKYLASLNISNARKMTNEQKVELAKKRRDFVASLVAISNEVVKDTGVPDKEILSRISEEYSDFMARTSQEPTLSQEKRIEASVWVEIMNGRHEDNLVV